MIENWTKNEPGLRCFYCFLQEMRRMKKTYLPLLLLAVSCYIKSQPVKLPFGFETWDTIGTNLVIENYMGKESLALKSGALYTRHVDFKDGILELDMTFPKERSFPGLAFRMQDLNNFENFYVRP